MLKDLSLPVPRYVFFWLLVSDVVVGACLVLCAYHDFVYGAEYATVLGQSVDASATGVDVPLVSVYWHGVIFFTFVRTAPLRCCQNPSWSSPPPPSARRSVA